MRTCDEWWTTTTANPNMFARPKYQTDQIEDHLMMWPDVDAAILAIELGLNEGEVKACQRRLGLRKCAVNNSNCTGRYALDMRGRNRKKPK